MVRRLVNKEMENSWEESMRSNNATFMRGHQEEN